MWQTPPTPVIYNTSDGIIYNVDYFLNDEYIPDSESRGFFPNVNGKSNLYTHSLNICLRTGNLYTSVQIPFYQLYYDSRVNNVYFNGVYLVSDNKIAVVNINGTNVIISMTWTNDIDDLPDNGYERLYISTNNSNTKIVNVQITKI